MPLAAWKIGEALPQRLTAGQIDLEKHLEDWIASDPGLVDRGLLVVQRQMHVDGGFLDLLCVDLQGRATVIEIKRGKLIRDTIAQALDYASSIASLPSSTLHTAINGYVKNGHDHPGLAALLDESDDSGREVAVIVVGVGAEPGLERMIDFLGSRYSVPIRAVTFDVFSLDDGSRILVREETAPDSGAVAAKPQTGYTPAAVIAFAGGPESPRGRRLTRIVEAAERHGLYARPYKYSFMFTSPSNKTRSLAVIWSHGFGDELRWSHSAESLAEFLPITSEDVLETLGSEGQHTIASDAEADALIRKLDVLFARIAQTEGKEPDGEAG
jgi:hypothetical protein